MNCLRFVRENSDVPVPNVVWYEPDPSVLEYPFYVMDRVEGEVPADMPPYLFAGFVAEATPEQRATLRRNALDVLARLHAIDVSGENAAFLDRPRYGATALDQHVNYQREYYDWAREGVRYPIIEELFDWLEARRPDDERRVLNWGDSRVGNLMFRNWEPVAVFDWEMAALGAPEVDLAWMVEMHDFFQIVGEDMGLAGLPDFMDREAVVATYEDLSGKPVQHFDWYYAFAALRFGIVTIRTTMRGVAYDQAEPPATPNDAISNRALIERVLG